jgi:lipopolysaccharide transport system permease protein
MATMPARWIVTPRQGGTAAMLREMWRYRGMLGFLGSRALRRIYRRTVLGWVWLLIIPLFPLTLQTLVFGGLLGVASDGVPYFLFLSSGTVIWGLFSSAALWGTRGLEMNRGLVEVVYLPRAMFPIGNMTPAFLDFGVKLIVLLLAVAGYFVADGHLYVRPGVPLLLALLSLVVVLVFAVGITLFTSVWGETTRDMRYAMTQLLPVWFLVTPVLYPLSSVPDGLRQWMRFNPVTPLVETFRWGTLGVGAFDPREFGFSIAVTAVLLACGLFYFARADASSAESR